MTQNGEHYICIYTGKNQKDILGEDEHLRDDSCIPEMLSSAEVKASILKGRGLTRAPTSGDSLTGYTFPSQTISSFAGVS
jgi:hypothetical protein